MTAILRARDIYKNYQVGEIEQQVLKGLSFEIFEGEFVVILGPSGSGKSTLLNILGGIDSATRGELFFKDRAIHGANENEITRYRRENIGFVFQFYNLIPNLSAKENIDLAGEISQKPISSGELLAEIGLEDRADYFPSKLSGGQQPRIAIARALAKNPDLLLCDEPTGALDLKSGIEILNLLAKFNKAYGSTVVIITHNAQISQIANRAFYIKDGLLDKVVVNENPVSADEVNW